MAKRPELYTASMKIMLQPSEKTRIERDARKASRSISNYVRERLGLEPAPQGRRTWKTA